MPLTFVSFMTGTLATYEQDPALYGTFTLVNGMLGASVFFFHCTGNERVSYKAIFTFINVPFLYLGKRATDESL